MELEKYPNRDGLIADIATARAAIVTKIAAGIKNSDEAYGIDRFAAAYKDLVQSLAIIDDNDRRNAAFNSEIGSLNEMKDSLMKTLTEGVAVEVGDKKEYVSDDK